MNQHEIEEHNAMLLAEMRYEEAKHNRHIEAIRRRGLATISEVVKAVTQLYVDLYGLADPAEINRGMCEDFAEDVCSLVPGAEAWWADELGRKRGWDGSHKLIKYQGRYYDSECPEGNRRWRALLH
jgi:hypothetical protein